MVVSWARPLCRERFARKSYPFSFTPLSQLLDRTAAGKMCRIKEGRVGTGILFLIDLFNPSHRSNELIQNICILKKSKKPEN